MMGDGERDGDWRAADTDPAFAREVLEGLSRPQKAISSKWLYDRRGSELFEEITQLEEYYPTRTETAILEAHAADMAARIGPGAVIVEYGAGAAVKTRHLLDALERPRAYAPMDISEDFLKLSAADVAADYPGLDVVPIIGNFLDPPDLSSLPDGPRCGFFPGSTIGNLTDAQITAFLTGARRTLGPDAKFLLGFDLRKPADILVPAYDDARGVTAAFNLNLLKRMNRELGAGFDLAAFAHEARWNDAAGQIEMHIVSLRDQRVEVAGRSFDFAEGETIHTEISRKFSQPALEATLAAAGWRVAARWLDEKSYFCVALLA